jgi:hypothetical protein
MVQSSMASIRGKGGVWERKEESLIEASGDTDVIIPWPQSVRTQYDEIKKFNPLSDQMQLLRIQSNLCRIIPLLSQQDRISDRSEVSQ